MPKDTTLENELKNNRKSIRFAVVAGFLLLISFLTFSFVAFDDSTSPRQSQKNTIPVQPTPVITKLTNTTYNFVLDYSSNLRTEFHTTESGKSKITEIEFGNYGSSPNSKGEVQFRPHVTLKITENVQKTTKAETILGLKKNEIVSSKSIQIDKIAAEEVKHTKCASGECVLVVLHKNGNMYEFSYQDSMYKDEFDSIVSSITFTQ